MSTTRTLRPEHAPPFDIEAEESVLGGMMLSATAAGEVIAMLQAGDFYRSKHASIFTAIHKLYLAGQPIDVVTVAHELGEGAFDHATGLVLHELVELVPSPGAAPYYARIVADCARLRRIRDAGQQLVKLAEDTRTDPAEALSRAESILAQATTADSADIASLADVLTEVLAQAERAFQGEAQLGIPTGFRDIDNQLCGLDPGRLYVLAARPGVGKSALAANIARNAAGLGHRTLVVSLEMSASEIVQRLCAAESRVPLRSLRVPSRMTANDWSRFSEAANRIAALPLAVVDSASSSAASVRSIARRMKVRDGLGLVVVDYVQLMVGDTRRYENRQQEVSDISRSLKVLAKDLHVPVLAVSQLNRQSEYRADRKPVLADLRESGSLEQDADVVAFLFRPKEDGPVDFIVEKQRNGPTGTVPLTFLGEFTQFRDCARTS